MTESSWEISNDSTIQYDINEFKKVLKIEMMQQDIDGQMSSGFNHSPSNDDKMIEEDLKATNID